MCEAHFLYKPFYELPNLSQFIGKYIEVRIESAYLSHWNPAIVKRHIWGNDFYTSSSDAVCVLIHTGAYKIGAESPDCAAVSVYFKVAKNRANYNNVFRNGIKSRKITSSGYEGHSIRFELVQERKDFDKNEDELVNLVDLAYGMPTKPREVKRKQKAARKAIRSFKTIYGLNVDKFGISRGSMERESEFLYCFNLSGQPVHRYVLGEFGDKKKPVEDEADYLVSEHLNTHCCYLETLNERFELSRNGDNFDVKKVKDPYSKGCEFMEDTNLPLEPKDIESDFLTGLKWSDFKWGLNKVSIKDQEINDINSYLWMKRS